MEFVILALTLENTILLHTNNKGTDQPVKMYSKTCLKWPLKKRPKVVFKTDHRFIRLKVLQNEHSAILLTFIKLPFVIKTFFVFFVMAV